MRVIEDSNVSASEAAQQMEQEPIHVILASGSQRRSKLLADAGVKFVVRTPRNPVDESLTPDDHREPEEAAKRLAQAKAGAVLQELLADNPQGVFAIIGADTMVVHNGEIFGKPKFVDDAKRMLRALSGSTHEVITAVSLWMLVSRGQEDVSVAYRTFVDKSHVTFKQLSDEQIVEYLRKGESFDKAGAYAIQGEGAALVDHYDGSYDTIVGLPVERLLNTFPDLLQ